MQIDRNKVIAMWAVHARGKIHAMFNLQEQAQEYVDNRRDLEWEGSIDLVTFHGVEKA